MKVIHFTIHAFVIQIIVNIYSNNYLIYEFINI
jgi:hypothetical protein